VVERQHRDLSGTFAALGDPTRRALLARLRRGPCTISELAEPLPMSFAAVSKHLAVLERAGLVAREIRGREHHCRLSPAPLRDAARWVAQYADFWEQRLDALDAYLRVRAARPSRRKR